MDETSQQGLEIQNSNEDEGIRCRLRDRNLLRKRKAEAEEKETNQWLFGMEVQSKRSKATEKSSTKKRGRPRKLETGAPLIPVVQEKAASAQEDPGVFLVPEAGGSVPDQKTGSQIPLTSVASQPTPLPVQPSVQSPVCTLSSPALVNPAPNMTTIQDSTQEAVIGQVLSQDSTLYSAPAPQQVEILYPESLDKEVLDQILIEDSGSNEEKNKVPLEGKQTNEEKGVVDFSETRLMTEQSRMYSLPSFSSTPLTKEYLPGN